MENTGERYLPLSGGPEVTFAACQIAYEHWHRYLFASQFVTGKEVLDIASGEGYGSGLLAESAKHVVGVDPDPAVVWHAGSKYLRPNLEFRCGSAEAIPCEGRHLFDVVVSFETIEHIWEGQQEKLLHEIRRVLRPEGVLLVSTPNKLFYSDRPGHHNPFHRREFYCHEYLGLLKRFFPSVHLLGQKVYGGSYLWPLGGPPKPLSEFQLTYADDQFGPASGEKKEALYLLAVCSGGPLETPGGSLLIDVSEQAVRRSLEGPAEEGREAQALSAAVASKEQSLPAPSENNNEVLGAIGQLRDALQAHVAAEAERSPAGLILQEKEAVVAKLRRRNARLKGENDGLRREAEELRRYAQALAAENEAKDRAAAELQGRLQGLTQEVEAARGAAEELRQAVAEREARAGALAAEVEGMAAQGRELRELLLDAHDQLQRRDEEIQATLAAALQEREAALRQAVSPRLAGESAPPAAAPRSNGPVVTGPIAAVKARGATTYLVYQLLIRKVREAVEGAVPAGATVLVVSKGDEELLRLEGRRGWHFPQRPDGVYAGHHPADSATAVAYLEELRARGADYLLIPQTSLWWLDHYADFRRHLEGRYRAVLRQPDVCVIYALREQATGKHQQYQDLIRKIRETVSSAVPAGATVAVVSKGDGELLQFEGRRGWHFPQGPDGVYAGHHPADAAAAVAHLEELRARGADYLLIPQTSLWWLDHYPDFRRHLEDRYRPVARLDDVCHLYALQPSPEVNGGRPRPAQQTSAAVQRPFGVNVAGYIASEKAVGEVARSTLRCAQAVNIPCVLNGFTDPESANQEMRSELLTADNPYSINLVHINAVEMPDFVRQKGEGYFRGHYNIGYWCWELSEFPREWAESFRYFDEIWVLSNFNLDAISRVSPVPVVRIPPSLNENLAVGAWGRSRFDLPEGQFIFLYMFDFHSGMERKNPLGLIEAFKRAFPRQKDALLVLKCSRPSSAELQALREAAAGANVRILNCVLSREEINSLLQFSDCYVSLHRSEGFGLTIAEAMLLEKPVIATCYSGNTDFMTPRNSFPVKYALGEIKQDYEYYRRGYVWAEPDLDHAAELMRFVYANRRAAHEVARNGRQDIIRHFHPRVVGELMKDRFLGLAALGKVALPDSWASLVGRKGALTQTLQYQWLIHQIREVVLGALPSDAIALVISKGDGELLRLGGGRTGWHFPQREGGAYTGHYPADSAAAITHLEVLRAKGAGFLLIPRPFLWWLDQYADLRRHLESRYDRIYGGESCVIYRLSRPAPGLLRRALRVLWPGADSGGMAAFHEVRLSVSPVEVNNLKHRGNTLEGTGGDPYLVLALERPQWVSAIRLTYSYRSGSPPLYLQLYWQRSDKNVFTNDERNVRLEQQLGVGERTELIVVNDVIDRIRLDPDDDPCVFQVGEITLLVPASDPGGPKGADKAADYQQLVPRVRQAIGAAVPAGATVLVVSKGDEELLRLEGRTAWHFPRTDGGAYSGHHPADSAAAIGQLEVLRGRGASYLVFPATALWWLDHYGELKQHLEGRYRRVHSDDSCVIYQLAGTRPGLWRRLLRRLSPSG
jgi:SAM-dependent methyltransferase